VRHDLAQTGNSSTLEISIRSCGLLQRETVGDLQRQTTVLNLWCGSLFFKPYKVAISGLYKSSHFSLLLPVDGKPVMLDDTCYLLGSIRWAKRQSLLVC